MTKRRHRRATTAKYRKSRKHTRKGVARKRKSRSQRKSKLLHGVVPAPIMIPPSPAVQDPNKMNIDELNDGVHIEEIQESTASMSTPQKKQIIDRGEWIRRLTGDTEDDTVDNADTYNYDDFDSTPMGKRNDENPAN